MPRVDQTLRRTSARFGRGRPAGRRLLSQSDFAYLGSYSVANSVGEGVEFGAPVAHRYVGGELRFLVDAYNVGLHDLTEFKLNPSGFGSTISSTHRTNYWRGSDVWQFRAPQALTGHHFGIWYEDLGGGAGRLWQSYGIDYSGSPYAGITSAVATCELSGTNTTPASPGTVNNYKANFGFQGVSQRCVMGRVQKNPAWFSSQYGVGPYLYGFGGYSSLMDQGGQASLGLFCLAAPDVTANYVPKAYPTPPTPAWPQDGSDYNVPASDFKILADHRSGTTAPSDWYTSPGTPATFDRGARLTAVANYYDGGANSAALSGTATFTLNSVNVTFSQTQTLAAGNWIGPGSGSAVVGGPGQVLAASVSNSLTATLTAPYTGATTTSTCRYFLSPPNPPVAGPYWNGTAPDGKYRWEWGASYFATGNWIDGPNKYGLVAVMSGAAGKAWYHSPGNFLSSDSGAAEIHVFDPADLGAAALGTKNTWNVQPAAMKDVTADLTALGVLTRGHGNEDNCPAGATFDAVTNRLWLYSPHVSGTSNSLLSCYGVNC